MTVKTVLQETRRTENPRVGEPPPTNTEPETKTEKTNTQTVVRPRNLLFDALCEIGQTNPEEAARVNGGLIGKALRDIRRMSPDVTADEIRRRAANYRDSWPNAQLTASALAKHWATFGTALRNGAARPLNPEAQARLAAF